MFFFSESEFNERNRRLFSEVDINGQSADPDNQNNTDTDYTIPEPVNAAGADNNPPPEGNTPLPEEDNPAPPPDNDTGDDVDYTQDTGRDEAPPPEDEGGDEGDIDYTQDAGGDAGGDPGDPPPEDGNAGAPPAGGDGQIQADDARGLENELFKDLTPDQLDLKHNELKNNFMTLYNSIASIIDRVNDIPTSEEYNATISFVSNQLADLRTMVADYMNNVYSTKSYMENAMNYNRFLATLNGINDILDEVAKEFGKATEEGSKK